MSEKLFKSFLFNSIIIKLCLIRKVSISTPLKKKTLYNSCFSYQYSFSLKKSYFYIASLIPQDSKAIYRDKNNL